MDLAADIPPVSLDIVIQLNEKLFRDEILCVIFLALDVMCVQVCLNNCLCPKENCK